MNSLIDARFAALEKGRFGGVCKRGVCSNTPAVWYSPIELAHYCQTCAHSINDWTPPHLPKMTPVADSEEMAWLREGELRMFRKLPNGEIAAVQIFMFTVGILVGVNRWGYRVRYCFSSFCDATEEIDRWSGEGDPTGWIKKKGRNLDGTVADHGPEQEVA